MTCSGRNRTLVGQHYSTIFLGMILLACAVFLLFNVIIATSIIATSIFIVVLIYQTSRFDLSIDNNEIEIKQSAVFITYKKLNFPFISTQVTQDGTEFINENNTLLIENYDGDGDFWFDFPECILVSTGNSRFSLCGIDALDAKKLQLTQ